MKRKLAVLAVGILAAVGLAGCFPGGGGGGYNFETDVENQANALRAAYGKRALYPNDWLRANSAITAVNCASWGAGAYWNVHGCHDFTAAPENIAVWLGSCDTGPGRAYDVVWSAWRNSPGHLAFMVDFGWPPKTFQGASSVCANGVQVIVWSGA